MSTNQQLGRTEFQRVNILPELSFDMLAGRPEGERLGKTHAPVSVLPSLDFDMLTPSPTPILHVTISFSSEAQAAQVAGDCHRLFMLLNEYDLALGGNGMCPVDLVGESSHTDGQVHLAFRPANPNNAAQRMSSAVGAFEKAVKQLTSIRECHVRIAA